MTPTETVSSNDAVESIDLLDRLGAARDRHGRVTVSCEYLCHSGETFGGTWRGVSVGDLLADAPPETTHVRAVSDDGYCVPVPVIDALEAVVATERVTDGVDAGDETCDDSEELPRLVGDGLDGSWSVRELARLEPVALPADADAEPRFLDEPDADETASTKEADTTGKTGGPKAATEVSD